MARDILSLIQYEAKRDPEVAALVARAPTLTDAEIDSARVKLPWMRKALRAIRDRAQHPSLETLVLGQTVIGVSTDPIGEMRRWNAGSTFVRVGNGHLEIKCGDLIWISADGVWIDTICCRTPGREFLLYTESLGNVSRSEYTEAIRNRLKLHTPTEMTTGEPQSRFRFYRPA